MDRKPGEPEEELGIQETPGAPRPPWELTDKVPLESDLRPQDDAFRRQIGAKQARKLVRRKERGGNIWFDLGMFGIIGWSVAVPTVIGVGIGYLIDRNVPGRISWTLTLLVVGLCLGCMNAWYWVARQRRAIEQRQAEIEAQERAAEEERKQQE